MLKLELFGSGKAYYLNRPLSGFPNQQAHLLLCFLLLNRKSTHAREQLVTELWEDDGTADTRKQLRNALWRLRQSLQALGVSPETYLTVTDDAIAFDKTSSYWLDVEIFETTATKFLDIPGESLKPDQVVELESVLEHYRGDLLEGIYEGWCLHERERLKMLNTAGLKKLMDFHQTNANFEQALAYGQRILADDCLQESIHRQVMQLYWQLGNRDAAVRQYRRCVEILQVELGVPPMPVTKRLYRDILTNPGYQNRSRQLLISNIPGFKITGDSEKKAGALQQVKQLKAAVEEIYRQIHNLESVLQKMSIQDDSLDE